MGRVRNKHMIILRGLPASGKTERAGEILKEYDSGEIFSAADFLQDENGWVKMTNERLQNAHEQTRKQAFDAIKRRVHPIVIDNTNLERWEMRPYVCKGFWRGYFIMFEDLTENIPLETRFSWCSEGISLKKLREMQKRYEPNVNFWKVFYDPECERKRKQTWMFQNI